MSLQHKMMRSRENSAYKLKGAGDGYNKIKHPTKNGPILQEQTKKLTKAKSVAEITPTKSRNRIRYRDSINKSSGTLHATPRPLPSGVDLDVETPTSRRSQIEKEQRLIALVYQRMLLLSWRRNKQRLATLSESLRRRQEQMANLEKQVNCLKDLTQSECLKRTEAINNHNQMKTLLESEMHKNELLEATKTSLQIAVGNLEERVQILGSELRNAKNEIESKIYKIRNLEVELEAEKTSARRTTDDHENQMNQKDSELKKCEFATAILEEKLTHCEHRLRNASDEISNLNQQVDKLSENYTSELSENSKLHEDIDRMNGEQTKLLKELEEMHKKCQLLEEDYARILEENHKLKDFNVEKEERRKYLWDNMKEFVTVSWILLQNAAYVMLPAL